MAVIRQAQYLGIFEPRAGRARPSGLATAGDFVLEADRLGTAVRSSWAAVDSLPGQLKIAIARKVERAAQAFRKT